MTGQFEAQPFEQPAQSESPPTEKKDPDKPLQFEQAYPHNVALNAQETSVILPLQQTNPSAHKFKAMIKRKPGLIPLAILVLAVLYCGINYLVIFVSLDNKNFEAAANAFNRTPFSFQLFTDQYTYCQGGLRYEQGHYSEAIDLWTGLNGLDTDVIVQEAKYKWAAQEANNNNFTKSIALYEELGDYHDSEALCIDARIRYVFYTIEVENDAKQGTLYFYQNKSLFGNNVNEFENGN